MSVVRQLPPGGRPPSPPPEKLELELETMRALAALLSKLEPAAQLRVLNWAQHRVQPPYPGALLP